ncbi:hypothetical protein O181_098909 [Austropuccinia psidii MF-1]|uniref:Uncharacterized protein n=1 Tax=Austropuccinia psidii MF-1 TaxID=1389203 RepID=A0A9Q3JC74_9BASI|nr:hypothetical protein [Austropuccinia psidii MF-1]
MEETIQSNQMDVDKEEARPNPEVSNLPQERHIWRMPEFPPIPQAKEEEWEICPSLWQELSGSGEDHRTLRRLEPIVLQRKSQKDKELVEEPKSFIHRPEEGVGNEPALETEGLVASTGSKPAPEVSKDKPKGPQKKQKGPKHHQGKCKGKEN